MYTTGASRGIGAGMVKAMLDRPDIRCDGFSRKGNAHADGSGYRDHQVDLADLDVLERFDFPAPHSEAKLLVLVNNAGTLEPLNRVGKLLPRVVDHAVRINLSAPMILSNAFVRQFGRHPATKLIVHVSSGAAQSAYAGWSVYCATKAGLDMLARVQEVEFDAAAEQAEAQAKAQEGKPGQPPVPGRCYVRAIAPGVVETGMQEMLRGAEPEAFPRKAKFVALHRDGQLSDADAVGRAYVEQFRAFAEMGPKAIPELISRLPQLPA